MRRGLTVLGDEDGRLIDYSSDIWRRSNNSNRGSLCVHRLDAAEIRAGQNCASLANRHQLPTRLLWQAELGQPLLHRNIPVLLGYHSHRLRASALCPTSTTNLQ